MFHAALARTDIADAVEGISAKDLLEKGNNLLNVDESARHIVHLTRFGIYLDRDVALDAVIDILPKVILANGKGDVIGGNLLRSHPMPGGGAITIVDGFDKLAAANGLLVIGRGDIDIV